jgi:hypothetical protein
MALSQLRPDRAGGAQRGRAHPRPVGHRRHAASVALPAALFWGSLCATPASAGESPSATCQAHAVGDRVLATIDLQGFVEEEMLRLLRLGMRGRVRVEATALRRRWGVFEQTVATRVVESQLSFTRDTQDLLLDARTRLPASGPITLERLALRVAEHDAATSRLTLRVSVQLQVVTMSSLSKVAAWATESSDDEASASILTRGLLTAVVNDLTRSAECTCAVTAARPETTKRR